MSIPKRGGCIQQHNGIIPRTCFAAPEWYSLCSIRAIRQHRRAVSHRERATHDFRRRFSWRSVRRHVRTRCASPPWRDHDGLGTGALAGPDPVPAVHGHRAIPLARDDEPTATPATRTLYVTSARPALPVSTFSSFPRFGMPHLKTREPNRSPISQWNCWHLPHPPRRPLGSLA